MLISVPLVLFGACGPDVGVVRNKNHEPVATIVTPVDQTVFYENDLIDFVGTVSDEEGLDTIQTVAWTSSLDFELGTPELVAHDSAGFSRFRGVLSVGSHVLSLVVTDDLGATNMVSSTITVLSLNQEPHSTILSPDNFSEVLPGDKVDLVGLVADEQSESVDLAVQWSAEHLETGNLVVLSESPPTEVGTTDADWEPEEIGSYLVRLRATDVDGNVGVGEIYVVVQDPELLDMDGDGWFSSAGDCDDSDPQTYPFAPELCGDIKDNDCNGLIDDKDVDRDGHIDEACVNFSGDWPADDCDDSNETIYPGAPELPDGFDNTCDGLVDEGTVHFDNDGDCYCVTGPCTGSVSSECSSLSGGDCDDAAVLVFPGAAEVCNEIDDDCDSAVDDDDVDLDASTGEVWYVDGDGDSYGDAIQMACVQPTGTVLVDGDCDDTDALIFPTQTEMCNGSDDDCDGYTDEDDAADATTWHLDADKDGFGDLTLTTVACVAPSRYVLDNSDCDDLDPEVFPGAVEVCNAVDDDCDSLIDDDDPGVDLTTATVWFEDDDEDGFGDAADTVSACDLPIGYVADDTDCDDTRLAVFPGADELCNTLDDDCDGSIDEDDAIDALTWYIDADTDGYGSSGLTNVACQEPAGFVDNADDCADLVATIFPGANEVCNELDDNCDGLVDDDDGMLDTSTAYLWYGDGDSDGFGEDSDTVLSCLSPAGYVETGGDCDDGVASIFPGATEVCNSVDDDCDGDTDDDDAGLDVSSGSLFFEDADTDTYGDGGSAKMACSLPTGYASNATDCDDDDILVYPGATESCNGYDDDCDGIVDEEGAIGGTTHYADGDGDSFGDALIQRTACSPPAGYVVDDTDCDDGDAAVFPGADEVCNGLDDDCDGDVDDDDSDLDTTTTRAFFLDDDGDGYGNAAYTTNACAAPAGYADNDLDCNDLFMAINPGALEYCNSVDDDCDTLIDEPDSVDANTYYADVDGDGYGHPSITARACTQPALYSVDNSDCNDLISAVNPGATEICNGIDDDCDGDIDDDDASLDAAARFTWYADGDLDGYGGATVVATACTGPSGATIVGGDCDDGEGAIYPGATETCNTVDDDCDGLVDDLDPNLDRTTGTVYFPDSDGDGYGAVASPTMFCVLPASGYVTDAQDCDDTLALVNPDAVEICDDGIDNDCDGTANNCRLVGDFTLNSDADVYFDGSNIADYSGQAVSGLGDWDGDGYAEILIAAPYHDYGNVNAGMVYVVGGNETASLDLDTDAIASLYGEDIDDLAGWGLDGGGDFDGDGVEDVLIGAYQAEGSTAPTNSGIAYLFLGTFSGINAMSSADASFEGDNTNGLLGRDVAFVGDLDNDLDDEIALAAPYEKVGTETYSGRLYVVNGSTTVSGSSKASTSAATAIEGEHKNAKLGYSEYSNATDAAGDVDGDGNGDLIVGSFSYEVGGASPIAKAGRAYLFYGSLPTGNISASTADVIVTGTNVNEYVGYSVAGPGDLDDDGYDDVVIGADGLGSERGAALVIYGGVSVASSWNSTNADAVLYGDDLGEHAGRSVAAAGDSDADGRPDFLVGAPYNSKLATSGGVVYVVFEAVQGTIYLGSDANVGRMYGDATQVYAGYAMAAAGDYDGDGNDDLLFGMGRYGSSAGSLSGRSYMYLGLGL